MMARIHSAAGAGGGEAAPTNVVADAVEAMVVLG